MSHYAADIVTFDLAPPLQTTGADGLKKSLEGWFPTFRGPSVTRPATSASRRVMTWPSAAAVTVGLRNIDGKWSIVHAHESVPFYINGSYRAAVDLKP
jgi:ketosteroid isomerase-like protein